MHVDKSSVFRQNALSKLTYALQTVVTGSKGLVAWVQKGSDNRKREAQEAVKEIILSYVTTVVVQVDPTNSVTAPEPSAWFDCVLDDTKTLHLIVNIDIGKPRTSLSSFSNLEAPYLQLHRL